MQILDPSFAKYRIYSSTVEQVATGMRWAEGPVYFPDGGYVLVSDIPNNRIMKFEREGRQLHRLPQPGELRQRQHPRPPGPPDHLRALGDASHHPHREGRQDHGARRRFDGKRLNAPNDIVVKSDDSIWFTDPLFGINGEWEGSRAKTEQATTNVYRIGSDGKIDGDDHRPRQPERTGVLARREEALRRRVERHAQPQHLELRRRRRRHAAPTRPS